MVVNYLNVLRTFHRPNEAHAPLVVDTNAVLPLAIPLQRFQLIARGNTEVESFLASVAVERNVAASTQNLALSAILFPCAMTIGTACHRTSGWTIGLRGVYFLFPHRKLRLNLSPGPWL